jgi:hypothetical protein
VDSNYWLSRQKEEAEMASGAASSEARLAHHELADRYSAKAIQAQAETLACWGAERVPADQYWVHGFSYSNAGDIIAAGRRGAAQ